MKNTFGNSLAVTLFGESHGKAIGAVIDGISPGVDVDENFIAEKLAARRPEGAETARRERDEFEILSGVYCGKTTGTPICIVIKNADVRSGDYDEMKTLARPSHADYSAYEKYHGFEDHRGGGHFSGRITAALVAAGAIAEKALGNVGVRIGTHILALGGVNDRPFSDCESDLDILKNKKFPVLGDVEDDMRKETLSAAEAGDSVGGIVQTAVVGLPAGVGEPWFDSLESVLSHALFSIGGIKGVEFGAGFALSRMRGSEANDPFFAADGKIYTKTNNAGGVNGGITNGMPVIFDCAVKPTPSIKIEQDTVDFVKGENAKLTVRGRHDPAIVRRVCPVVDAVTALAVADVLESRYGTDVFTRGIK